MGKVNFAMALHFHQPVGNFTEIFQRSFKSCYEPFLEELQNFPEVKLAIHLSGSLLDYLEEKHPEFLDKLKTLIDRGQIEIIGGGYYEPIFVAIPKWDRRGQINLLSRFIEKRFGVEPKGGWIPERVWTQELCEDFSDTGLRYSILDDTHFIEAGLKENEVFRHFITEYNNKSIFIFPSSRMLRHLIPLREPEEILDYFKNIGEVTPNPLFIYGDDGEKFGSWPYTYQRVYKEKWLRKFFQTLVKNKDWIETVKLSDYIRLNPDAQKVDIPDGSYEEMQRWSGGNWMNFFSRYPEADYMNKRMRYLSGMIEDLQKRVEYLKDIDRFEDARLELYKAQCNCCYWHGVFGGIYIYHLRKAVYEHIINVEKVLDEVVHKDQRSWFNVGELELSRGGIKAFIVRNKSFSMCIDPAHGGSIRELDCRDISFNLVNTLARHKEPYHNIEPFTGISYDKYNRACLLEHFIDKDVDVNDFANCRYIDLGDFANGSFSAKTRGGEVELVRKGEVEESPILITKVIRISLDTQIDFLYTLKNLSARPIDAVFGIEFNITMPHADSQRYKYQTSFDSFSINDIEGELNISFVFSERPDGVWYFPIKTLSQSEKGSEVIYQSSCIFPRWHIVLEGNKELRFNIKWLIEAKILRLRL